ncbi:hypothetical protein HYW73_00465 [Candidatus Nomurabacteria bacterium]|nr:hypothetical protein [Candidatus Nomurabacteria bacterium]
MPTVKSRINISVSSETKRILKHLARRDQMPTATKAERLLEMAMEMEEDIILSKIADERLAEKNIKWISHKNAWK